MAPPAGDRAQTIAHQNAIENRVLGGCERGMVGLHSTRMIRPFTLRDLTLIFRLRRSDLLLQSEAALISEQGYLKSTLRALASNDGLTSLVWKSDSEKSLALAQFRMGASPSCARLVTLSSNMADPDGDDDVDCWLEFFDQLVVAAGERGAANLVVEAQEDRPEIDLLRRAGFVVFTRQDLWRCDSREIDGSAESLLSKMGEVDEWDVTHFYSNLVPKLIQQVEPAPDKAIGDLYLLREDGELTALVQMHSGARGVWSTLLIHPNSSCDPAAIIREAQGLAGAGRNRPLYCSVRRYQNWLQEPLRESGFEKIGSQAVMVRHIARMVKGPVKVAPAVAESPEVAGSTTMMGDYSSEKPKERTLAGN